MIQQNQQSHAQRMEELLAFNKKEVVRGSTSKAMKNIGASRGVDVYKVNPNKLRIWEGFNPRFDTPDYLEHIANIEASIEQDGFYQDQPLAGFVSKEEGEDVVVIINGHTRTRAVQNLIAKGHPIESIPVIIKPIGTDMEALTIALKKSNDGKPLSPIGLAVLVKRLMALGNDEVATAKKLGITRVYVSDLLLLAQAPAALKDLVISGKITATLAIQELKANPQTAVERLLQAVDVSQQMGRERTTAKHLKQLESSGAIPVGNTKNDSNKTPKAQNEKKPLTRVSLEPVAPPAVLSDMQAKEQQLEISELVERLDEALGLDLSAVEILVRVQKILGDYR